ncbi:hypothetical protein [Endozoicomonas euniceicola]|uniref:Tetratricopeptide repeat protein n=1 Tax=Endozoicomonas euniceicola TaxID=1234143 RepID=A0ABY6H0Z0_9GAMM|nr:hypothetical protein [Endozoicomonas euniceicola]UYM18708.1 hypothetical protein NX720_12640 [Endozoicomonas euniceicola]
MMYSDIVKGKKPTPPTPPTPPAQQGTLPAQTSPRAQGAAAVTPRGRQCDTRSPSEQRVAGAAAGTYPELPRSSSSPRTCTKHKSYNPSHGQRGAARKQQAPPITGEDISVPLQTRLQPIGTVKRRFSSTQKDLFAPARVECEQLQTKLLQADKRQASNALKQLHRYAVIAGKGMDYQSSLQLLEYLLTDYLPGCSDKHLAKSARETVGVILDRLVGPLFTKPDFRKDESCELAREQLLELCQKRNFEPLERMKDAEKELLMYHLIKKIVNSKRYDQLSGFCETFNYEKTYKGLVDRTRNEKEFPKAPWCARLYWLVAAYYTHKLSLHELKVEFDLIEDEIKSVAGQHIEVDKAYLTARCELSNLLYESPHNENAMDKVSQLIAELQSCPSKLIPSSQYKELLIAFVCRSKVKILIDRGQLNEAGDLLKKVSEAETKYQVHSIKTEVLRTRLKRLTIGDQPKGSKDIEMIQQEIARLKQFGDKYHGSILEIVDCYILLGNKEAALEELKRYAGREKQEVLMRRAVLLSDLKRYSEAVETLRQLPDSGYSQSWKALTTHAVTLTNWANDGYEKNTQTGETRKVMLTEDDRRKYLLESLRLFRSAIECAPADYSGAWGGVGHFCDIQASAKLLNFQKYKHWLPEQIRHASNWGGAAGKAFSIEKGQTPAETARIQSGLKQTPPNESYSAAVKGRSIQ